MAKRSARIPEKREKKSELNCNWGLFSIFESHHGCASRKLLLNGRPGSKHILNEYPRKPDMLANFDEECRKIKDRASLASLTVDASEESLRNSNHGDMSTKKHKKKQIIDEKQKLGGTGSDVFDHSAKNRKISSKISESDYKSMVHHPKNAAKQMYQDHLCSAEIFPNKLNVAAILEATYNQIRQGDNTYCGGAVDDINVQLVQMSAKAFVDQMFLDRKFTSKEGSSSESKQFSDALEILNSNKDLYVKLLKDPNSILAKYIKNLQKLLMEKETTKSILDGNVSKFGRKDEGSFVKFECTAEIKKENMNNLLSEKIKYQREYPSKGSYTHQPANKIVVLKPTSRSIKYPENVACHCSSLQSRHSSSKKGPDEKPTYFCFREMKRKLKYSIGGSGNAADSSTNAKTKDETYEKLNLNSSDDTDTSCMNEMVCKKIDPSRVRFTEKQEPDIIMEAKRHLSARLKNVTATESPKGEKFPKTLGRILSTPEPDSRPRSPRRDGECDTASAQMRFDPCSDLQMAMESGWNIEKGRQRTRVSAWRQNAEVPSGVDFRKAGDSRIQNIVHEVNICSDSMYNGESHIEEVNGILEPGNMYTLEVPNELNSTDVSGTTKRSNTTEQSELQKEDCNATYSRLDSPSDNQIFTSALDDSPSSPSIYQLHELNGSKDQEMHRSPVSVLDPLFTDDMLSPPSIVVQSARKPLQPLRIDFEQYSQEESPIDPPVNPIPSTDEHDSISNYVHSVLEASRSCWNDLSMITAVPEQLLHASVFDEVEFLPTESRCDAKLIFDHMNEVLLEIYQRQISSSPWLSFIKPEIMSVLSEDQVFDEVTKKVKFHLLQQLELVTLDLLTESDVAKSGSWLDIRLNTEDIAIHISEDILEESIVDIILESNT